MIIPVTDIMDQGLSAKYFVTALLFLSVLSLSEGICRNLIVEEIAKNKALTNHIIRTVHPISDNRACKIACFLESRCFSFNVCTKRDRTMSCDLINSDHIRSRLVKMLGCIHYGSENACSSSPCPSNAECQGDFDNDPVPYRCICHAGYTGPTCSDDVDECKSGAHDCHVNAECKNAEGSYNCTCKSGYHGDGRNCKAIQTCKEMSSLLSAAEKSSRSLYRIRPDGVDYSVFCSNSNFECGPGKWNLALKIDGKKKNFKYGSTLWTDRIKKNTDAALTGLDDLETKTSAYWDTPLTKLCLGMKYGGVIRWIAISINEPSFHSFMLRNKQKITKLGEKAWKSLLPAGIISLETRCKKEGFNLRGRLESGATRRLRLGYFTDQSNPCVSYQSFIGIGSDFGDDKVGDDFSCGNYGSHKANNGEKLNTAFCYILVQ